MHLGTWEIDDVLTFPVNTHTTAGAASDASSPPTYRVYEDETGTALLNGSTAKLDDSNTTGFYSEQITLSAANGFEVGKCYTIYISATVGGVTGTMAHTFKVEAAPALESTAQSILTDTGTTLPASLATIAGYIDTEVAAILADTGTTLDGKLDAIQAVTDLLIASDSEPTGVPAANETPLVKLAYLFMALRNQVDVTATKKTYYDDGGSAEWEKDLSDDGSTYSESEANGI